MDRDSAGLTQVRRRILFLLFFVSGACGLLYQIVWLRLAFASFGVITPVLSVVIAIFMLGLALGSWGAGKWVGVWSRTTGLSAIYSYAAAEVLIGASAFAVPSAFRVGESWLLPLGETDSFAYLLYSALILTGSILPACIAMGTTYPLMLAFVKEVAPDEESSFSFLYVANVTGASVGTLLTAVALVELFGFRSTLLLAGLANFTIAAAALYLGRQHKFTVPYCEDVVGKPASAVIQIPDADAGMPLLLLFTTGFCALGLEVMWTRAFTPIMGTEVYAFALLLLVYLLATLAGSLLYRRHRSSDDVMANEPLLCLLGFAVLVPVLVNDPRLHNWPGVALLSIVPFSALLGYLTPKLIDQYSRGFPRVAGRAYAVNVLGSILGPLFAGYLLLPALGTRQGMVLLGLPFLVLLLAHWRLQRPGVRWMLGTGSVTMVMLICALLFSVSHEEGLPGRQTEIRRDHTATVLSIGEGLNKQMLVNGTRITTFTPITKIMAHMPLVAHPAPKSAAVICFGMGTTFRSAMSWGVEVSAVELVGSVRDAFGYYFDDALLLMQNPRGSIVIDDGRRFLQRNAQMYDVVTVDPPPPVEAAGSSLLYSKDFLKIVKKRLNRGGIMHHWLPASPGFDLLIVNAVSRSIVESFPHVRAFVSIEDWGIHFLASMEAIDIPSEEKLLARMPADARLDLEEWVWSQDDNASTFIHRMFKQEIDVTSLLGDDSTLVITDDRPFNEYYLLRRWLK
tara:strand:+ start:344 stop:2551 length:2208 start_codon:yes stop_codon:yes gene_type:complete